MQEGRGGLGGGARREGGGMGIRTRPCDHIGSGRVRISPSEPRAFRTNHRVVGGGRGRQDRYLHSVVCLRSDTKYAAERYRRGFPCCVRKRRNGVYIVTFTTVRGLHSSGGNTWAAADTFRRATGGEGGRGRQAHNT